MSLGFYTTFLFRNFFSRYSYVFNECKDLKSVFKIVDNILDGLVMVIRMKKVSCVDQEY